MFGTKFFVFIYSSVVELINHLQKMHKLYACNFVGKFKCEGKMLKLISCFGLFLLIIIFIQMICNKL